jgi:non-ribosomal peptide synthetase component F
MHCQTGYAAALTLHPCHGETLHARFERQAVHRPDAIAASCNGCHLSYSELNARANQVAHFLRRNGVVPETLVAICAERSLDLLVAVLEILKAGGAYLPIDPAYPAERQRFMIEESRAPFILTQRHIVPDLPSTAAQAICLDDPSSPVWAYSSDNPIHIGTRHDLAYVIYTSGSTGLPKGVEVSHQNVGRSFNSASPTIRRLVAPDRSHSPANQRGIRVRAVDNDLERRGLAVAQQVCKARVNNRWQCCSIFRSTGGLKPSHAVAVQRPPRRTPIHALRCV